MVLPDNKRSGIKREYGPSCVGLQGGPLSAAYGYAGKRPDMDFSKNFEQEFDKINCPLLTNKAANATEHEYSQESFYYPLWNIGFTHLFHGTRIWRVIAEHQTPAPLNAKLLLAAIG